MFCEPILSTHISGGTLVVLTVISILANSIIPYYCYYHGVVVVPKAFPIVPSCRGHAGVCPRIDPTTWQPACGEAYVFFYYYSFYKRVS